MPRRRNARAQSPSRTVDDVGRGANRTGAAGGGRRGRPRRWTDERIREELAVLLDGWEGPHFPTAAELRALGAESLLWAIERYGGVGHWARESKMPLGPRRDRRPYGFREAHADALEVIDTVGFLPGGDRLKQLGKQRLASYLYNHTTGREHFLRDIGFDEAQSRELTDVAGLPRKRKWTEQRIRDELAPLLAGLAEWPPDRFFIEAGRTDLLGAVRRVGGGKREWARRIGLAYRRPGRGRAAGS